MSSVGLDDWDAVALIGQRRVLSTGLPRNKNLPHTCWMNRLALSSNSSAFDSCAAYCFLALLGIVAGITKLGAQVGGQVAKNTKLK